jgi:hypothetical protein
MNRILTASWKSPISHPVSARIFAGDGCHRLALLLKQGTTILRPDQYETLDVSSPEYAAFISASFTDTHHNRLEDLLDDVAKRSPWRLGELREILSTDHPSLHAAH